MTQIVAGPPYGKTYDTLAPTSGAAVAHTSITSKSKRLRGNSSAARITDLPNDLLTRITEQLDVRSWRRARQTCRSWRAALSEPLYLDHYLTRLGVSGASPETHGTATAVQRALQMAFAATVQSTTPQVVGDPYGKFLGFTHHGENVAWVSIPMGAPRKAVYRELPLWPEGCARAVTISFGGGNPMLTPNGATLVGCAWPTSDYPADKSGPPDLRVHAQVCVWDTRMPPTLAQAVPSPWGTASRAQRFACSPSGAWLAITAQNIMQAEIKTTLWHLGGAKPVPCPLGAGLREVQLVAPYFLDDDRLVGVKTDGTKWATWVLYDLKEKTLLRQLGTGLTCPRPLDAHAAACTFAHMLDASQVVVWRFNRGAHRQDIALPYDYVSCLQLASNGRHLLAMGRRLPAGPAERFVVDLESEQTRPLGVGCDGRATAAAFSFDGKLVVDGDDNEVSITDGFGLAIRVHSHRDAVAAAFDSFQAVALAPGNHALVAMHASGILRAWRLEA